MISILNDAPENVAAFYTTGEISKEDFENLVIPHVKGKIERFNELNYLMYVDQVLEHSSTDNWLHDALQDIKKISVWNRAAVVTGEDGVQKFTDLFSTLQPTEFKSFPKENIYKALYWCHKGRGTTN